MLYNQNDENYVYEYVGKNIRKYRLKKGWTQRELAQASTYSKQFISNMENNVHQTFSLGTLWTLSRVLDVKLSDLCEEPEPEKQDIFF